MSRRLSFLPFALLLGACLIALPACKKKPTEGGGGGDPVPAPGGTPPAAVSSDYFLYAQLNAKSIRDSALFGEVKQAVTKAGAAKEWDEAETKSAAEIGVKWTEVDTATIVIPDAPAKGEPKMIAIIAANKAFDKAAMLKKEKVTTPDARGFYQVEKDTWLHFPDDKTLVVVSPDLAQKYLDGYAKNRTGWPLTAELTRAASGHTAFAVIDVQKAPRQALEGAGGPQFSALVAAQKVTVTANLKGKELSLGVRGTYADAATAAKAKDQAQEALKMATGFVDMFAGSKDMAEFAMAAPAVKEAQRAVKAVKVEVSGADVLLTGSYKADFDIGQMVAEAVKKIKTGAGRMTAQTNLKQIGLALHNYNDAMNRLPIHGVGANGAPLRNATDKPLLSWRVAILPYIEQDQLYKQFKHNEPWDSEHNKKLIAQMPKIYAPVEKPGKPGFTHLKMVVGPGGMPLTGISVQAIPDGSSNTIAVIETANPVEWTKPDDVVLPAKFQPGDLKKLFGGQFPGGFNVAMWDGSVRFIRDTVSENTLKLLFDPRDGMVIPNDWDGAPAPTGRK